MVDINKLIKCYRELGLTRVETLFLLEVAVADGKYKESEATFKYNASTIKKIRASLYQKALLTWTTKSLFADTLYVYDLSILEKKIEYIQEAKTNKARDLIRYFRAVANEK